jgi:hypothetical protein
MKIEEARETLKHIGEHIKVHDEHGLIYSAQLVGALEIADAAMEKQIPKEPTRYTCENDTCYNHTKCQVCGGGLDSTEKFCRDCGQAIKWR